MVQTRLRLYGAVAWATNGIVEPVRGRTRLGILLALAERQGDVVSVANLLDRFWDEPPQSGSNAVQRHISALRSQLAALGDDEPGGSIEYVSGGYRLTSSIATDLHEPSGAAWWLEPLVGSAWEPHVAFRSRLESVAHTELASWITSGAATSDQLVERVGSMSQHSANYARLADAAIAGVAAVGDKTHGVSLARSLHSLLGDLSPGLPARLGHFLEPDDDRSPSHSVAARQALRQVIGLWSAGRIDEALDVLDTARSISSDERHRICRTLIWQSPSDGAIRLQLNLLGEDAIVNEIQAERGLIALDSDALNQMPDGELTSTREIEGSSTPERRLRCLRTEFMRRLAHPRQDDDESIIDAISEIDLPDAAVETTRFRFILHLRDGEWAEAQSSLQRYGEAVKRHWPNSGDDFEPMAIASLQRSLDPDCSRTFSNSERLFGRFSADPWLLDVTEAGRRLLLNDPDEPLTDVEFHRALGATRPTVERAFRLLRDMNSGRPVRVETERFAIDLLAGKREKQFLYGPVALGRIAEILGDKDLANTAIELLLPWSGQVLGLWPVDLVLGRADTWIDRLSAV